MGLIEIIEASLAKGIVVGHIIEPFDGPVLDEDHYIFTERHRYFVMPKQRFDHALPHHMGQFMDSLVPKLKRKDRPKREEFYYTFDDQDNERLHLGNLTYREVLGVVTQDADGAREEVTYEPIPLRLLRQRPKEPPYVSVYERIIVVQPIPDVSAITLGMEDLPYSLIKR